MALPEQQDPQVLVAQPVLLAALAQSDLSDPQAQPAQVVALAQLEYKVPLALLDRLDRLDPQDLLVLSDLPA